MTEKLQGMALIRQTALKTKSGMVFDKNIAEAAQIISDETLSDLPVDSAVRQTVALFRHLPEPLQAGIAKGEINVLIDFTGNAAIYKQE